MPLHFLIRLASIAITVLVFSFLGAGPKWLGVFLGLAYAHYFIALIYSSRQFRQIGQHPPSYFPFAFALGVGFALYQYKLPLMIYFSVHHAFNEVYLQHPAGAPGRDSSDYRTFRVSALLLNLLTYFIILQHSPALGAFVNQHLFQAMVMLAACTSVYFYYLSKMGFHKDIRTLLDKSGFELIGLAFVGISCFYPILFSQVVCYHFIFWAIHPLFKLIQRGQQVETLKYAVLTVGLTAGLILLNPNFFGTREAFLVGKLWENEFFQIFSFLHITSSFALSQAQPVWITRWFAHT